MSDHLIIHEYTDEHGEFRYVVKDEISGDVAGRAVRFRWRAQARLDAKREWAKKTRPANPESMTRWLYGFPMLPEHDS